MLFDGYESDFILIFGFAYLLSLRALVWQSSDFSFYSTDCFFALSGSSQ